MKRHIATIIFLLTIFWGLAQMNEQRVFLWDVTGSLLPQTEGKSVGGKKLPGFKDGNGLFNDVQQAILDAIDDTEENALNSIVVIPFQENPLEVWEAKATDEGKNDLKRKVLDYTYKKHKETSVVNAIEKFVSLRKADRINYMFIFTDGGDQFPNKLQSAIDNWDPKDYGFYVVVDPDRGTHPKDNNTENFWFVNNAKARITTIRVTQPLTYNTTDQDLRISLESNRPLTNQTLTFTCIDPYYNISIAKQGLSNNEITLKINPKTSQTPEEHTLKCQFHVENDPFTFVTPQNVYIKCNNKSERVLKVSIE